MIVCDFEMCVYNEPYEREDGVMVRKCEFDVIEVNGYGKCAECAIVDIDRVTLAKLKQRQRRYA